MSDMTMDQMITDAATHWDGCDDVQYEKEASILEAQVETIYEHQHQDWHDEMFEPDVVKGWIRTAIKKRAMPFDRFLMKQLEGRTVIEGEFDESTQTYVLREESF